jgi:uncharacterized protein (UPF0218 family)
MFKFSQQIKNQLKKPLGKLHADFKEVKKLSHNHRIISVGDVCTLSLLAIGIRPHLAVFDYLFMRQDLDPGMIKILEFYFKKPKKYKNPPGTLSSQILADAPILLSKGGGVLIDGEEDLTALAFIINATGRDVIIYGQPGKGIVIVKPGAKIKRKVEKIILTATR